MPEKKVAAVHYIVPQKPGQVMYRQELVMCGKTIVPGEAGLGTRVTDIKAEVTCNACKAKLKR